MIFSFLEKRRLRKTIKQYVSVLGPALIKRYGTSEQYTVKQITKTVQALKLNNQYMSYAISLYRHEESENTINLYNIDQSTLNDVRSAISKMLFDGDMRYRSNDVVQLLKRNQWKGGSHGDWMANKRGQTGF